MVQRSRERRSSQDYRHEDTSYTRWHSRRSLIPRRLQRGYLTRVALLIIFVWSTLDALAVHSRISHPAHDSAIRDRPRDRIFIASIHWNNEAILRSHWNQAVLDLVRSFGRNNTFVSVQESGSWDDSKGALRDLETALEAEHFRHNVVLDDTTHLDEISRSPGDVGWIDTPRGRRELRRIPYLSRLRNLVLEPLIDQAKLGITFDKIVFLNDVIFTTRDIEILLDTRSGNFAAVCAMDFNKPPGFYDTFALRDAEGNNKLMKNWPYFRSAHSRDALKAGQPVPVASCWNGIAIMDAQPFYDTRTPLRFRGVSDSLAEHHIEASECCLIHADNPLSHGKGIWMHPDVRVAYNAEAHAMVNPATGSWLSYWTIYRSLWTNRLLRWTTVQYFRDRIVTKRVRSWETESSDHVEPGTACLINEMQVLVENGWAHV